MAGYSAQRIRVPAILAGLLLSAAAWAGWTGVRVCHIEKNRAVVFAGSQRFVLQHQVGWTLQDPSQQKAFLRALNARDLPTDPGELLEAAPSDNVVKVLGRIGLSETAGSSTIKLMLVTPKLSRSAILSQSTSGLTASDELAESQIDTFCGEVGIAKAALLKELSGDKDATLSESAAWAEAVKRADVGREQFFLVPGNKGVIWVLPGAKLHRSFNPGLFTAAPSLNAIGPKVPAAPPQANIWLPLGVTGGAVLAALIAIVGVRWRRTGGFVAWVSGHERELIQKVRDDVARGQYGGPDPEGKAVGKVLEAYQEYDRAVTELDKLREVRQFEREYQEFQEKYEAAVSEVQRQNGHARTLLAQLQAERTALEALQTQMKLANNENEGLRAAMAEANKLLEDFEGWCGKLNDQIRTIAENEKYE